MKIAVCIKRVPDTEARIKIGADGVSIDEAGVKFVLNPYDEFAVEAALQRKEKAGAGGDPYRRRTCRFTTVAPSTGGT